MALRAEVGAGNRRLSPRPKTNANYEDTPSRRRQHLLPIFRADHVPLVLDGAKFLGLITRIDLLNYLRRRMK